MGDITDDRFNKPLQRYDFQEFRADIQVIPEDTSNFNLGWYRPEGALIPIAQKCVGENDGNFINKIKRLMVSQE